MICKSEIAPSKIAVMAPTEIAVAHFVSGGDVVVSDFILEGSKLVKIFRDLVSIDHICGGVGGNFMEFFYFGMFLDISQFQDLTYQVI